MVQTKQVSQLIKINFKCIKFILTKDRKIFLATDLLRQAFSRYKWQIIILTILGFLSGLLESVGITAIIPLFSLIFKNQGGGTDIISQTIEKFFDFLHLPFNITLIIIFIIILFLLKALVLILANYINATITSNYERQMRSEMFERVLQANWPYLLNQKIGYLEKVIMDHIVRTSEMLRHLSGAILIITNLLIYIFIAINISSTITLLTLSLGCILFLVYKPMAHKIRKISQRYTESNKIVANIINENMIGIKTVKATVSEEIIKEKGDQYFEILKNDRIKLAVTGYVPMAFLQPVSIIFILIIFMFSYTKPLFNIASFAVIIYLIQKIFTYIQNAQGRLQAVYETVPYLKSVVDHQKIISEHKEASGGAVNIDFKNVLQFKNVSFAYNKNKGIILDRVAFSVTRGETVGLVGPSGAGKTTIVDLLLRLFEPDSGEILMDNHNIKTFNIKEWRKMIGYVSQDIFLINDSIENNIKFYNDSISREKITEAAKMANIYDFIQTLPGNFSAPVGERGVFLSAGQRQRIILARVLARSPKLLILDEATSALDNESEALIQSAIKNLKGKITVLAIAHRISTVLHSDKIIAIENGTIVEQGKPEELLKDKNSYFYRIYSHGYNNKKGIS